jgi:hypothetical protein
MRAWMCFVPLTRTSLAAAAVQGRATAQKLFRPVVDAQMSAAHTIAHL